MQALYHPIRSSVTQKLAYLLQSNYNELHLRFSYLYIVLLVICAALTTTRDVSFFFFFPPRLCLVNRIWTSLPIIVPDTNIYTKFISSESS